MFKMELHAHCGPGSCDSRMGTLRLLTSLKEAGYDGVMLTNHYDKYQLRKFMQSGYLNCEFNCKNCENTKIVRVMEDYNDSYCYIRWMTAISDAQAIGKLIGIRVYCGMEYTLQSGEHASLIGCSINDFMTDIIELEQDIKYLRTYADRHNALIILNHPLRDGAEPTFWGFDGYETINTKYGRQDVFYPTELRQKDSRFTGIYVCGGDIHTPVEIGRSFMIFPNELKDEQDLVNHLKFGQYHMKARMYRDEINSHIIIYS